MERIVELSKRLFDIKIKKDNLKTELEAVDKQFRSLEAELVSEMDQVEIKSMKVDGVGNVIRTSKHVASIQDKPTFYEYLDKNDLNDLITRTVNYHTLNKLNLTNFETEGRDLPGCESFIKESVTIRKAK